MSIETLKQHTNRKIEELTEKKTVLHAKLQERGVLDLGWSILPELLDLELEAKDWTTVIKVIESAGPLSTSSNQWANTVVRRLTMLIEHEKEAHCDGFFIPEGSNRLKNAIDLITLNHKPSRWETISNAINIVLE